MLRAAPSGLDYNEEVLKVKGLCQEDKQSAKIFKCVRETQVNPNAPTALYLSLIKEPQSLASGTSELS